MVIRRRLRAFLTALGLYGGAALFIGYFGVNAYTGNHGLRAKHELDLQYSALSDELGRLKRERTEWQRRGRCHFPCKHSGLCAAKAVRVAKPHAFAAQRYTLRI